MRTAPSTFLPNNIELIFFSGNTCRPTVRAASLGMYGIFNDNASFLDIWHREAAKVDSGLKIQWGWFNRRFFKSGRNSKNGSGYPKTSGCSNILQPDSCIKRYLSLAITIIL